MKIIKNGVLYTVPDPVKVEVKPKVTESKPKAKQKATVSKPKTKQVKKKG